MSHHHLIKINLSELRPTQFSVGYAEVVKKRAEWRALGKKKSQELIKSHWFPSILGPERNYFIVDHHHLGVALHEEGQETVFLTILKDLSWLNWDVFWKVMEFHQWVHPYDERGRRKDFKSLPQHIAQLKDDPFRSLAGLAREKGAFAKDLSPFNEFLWADYFRQHISLRMIEKSMDKSLIEAMSLAKYQKASYLPGWIGGENLEEKLL